MGLIKSGTTVEADEIGVNFTNFTNLNGTTVQEVLNYIDTELSSITAAQQVTGWKDNVIPLTDAFGKQIYSPLWADMGNGIYAYHFEDSKRNEMYATFNINHDYKVNSLMYPHIHWAPMSASTGNVRWVIEYTLAKGHTQGDIVTGIPTQVVLNSSGTGTIGEHIIVEVPLTAAFSAAEPDTVVLMTIYRDAANVGDTFVGDAVIFMLNIHYQSDHDTTLGKSTDFNTA